MSFTDHLTLLDTISLLHDELADARDLFAEQAKVDRGQRIKGGLPPNKYIRLSSFQLMLRSVLATDRLIQLQLRRPETIALFVPKDVHVLPMMQHSVFAGEGIEHVLSSDLVDLHPSTISVFTNEAPWTEVVNIESASLTRYSTHYSHGWSEGQPIRMVPRDRFHKGGLVATSAWFDVVHRILHLSAPLDADSFLVFSSVTVNGVYEYGQYGASTIAAARKTPLANVKLKCPIDLEDVFIRVAYDKLLKKPVSAAAVRELVRGYTIDNGAIAWQPEARG